MLESLKTVLHAGKMPECFGVVKSTSRFFRRPPSVNSPESCRKVLRPPEVSVPPEKQRLLTSKFGSNRLRRAHTSLPDSKVAWRRNQAAGEKLQVDDNRPN